MYSKVFFLSCLLAVTLAAPAADPEADANPEADADPYYGHAGYAYGHGLVYHVPNCTVEEKTITVKQCTPKVEEKCEDVVYKTIKVSYEEECTDVVTKHCSDGSISTNEVEGDGPVEAARKRREAEPEADADPYYGYYGYGGIGYGAYHHGLPHPVVTIKHHCVETPHKSCITKPVSEEVEKTVPHCVLVTTAECADVEHTVPHTVCV